MITSAAAANLAVASRSRARRSVKFTGGVLVVPVQLRSHCACDTSLHDRCGHLAVAAVLLCGNKAFDFAAGLHGICYRSVCVPNKRKMRLSTTTRLSAQRKQWLCAPVLAPSFQALHRSPRHACRCRRRRHCHRRCLRCPTDLDESRQKGARSECAVMAVAGAAQGLRYARACELRTRGHAARARAQSTGAHASRTRLAQNRASEAHVHKFSS